MLRFLGFPMFLFLCRISCLHIFPTVDMLALVHKITKWGLGQYPAILTELAWSIKHLLHGIKNTEKMIFKLVYFRHSASVNSSCALCLFKCGIVFFKCFVRRVCPKKLFSEEFRLWQSLSLVPVGVTRCKERVLECLRWFQVRPHVENWFFVESLTFNLCTVVSIIMYLHPELIFSSCKR